MTRNELKKLVEQEDWAAIQKVYPDFVPRFIAIKNRTYFSWTSMTPEMNSLWRNPKNNRDRPTMVNQGLKLQLIEHLGDGVLQIAARNEALKMFPQDKKAYFNCYHALITNENLKTADYSSGDAAEIDIGNQWITRGLVEAVTFAEDILVRSKAWAKFEKLSQDIYGPTDSPLSGDMQRIDNELANLAEQIVALVKRKNI